MTVYFTFLQYISATLYFTLLQFVSMTVYFTFLQYICKTTYFTFLQYISTNLLLSEREGRTGEYWPEVMAVQKRPRANIPQYGSS